MRKLLELTCPEPHSELVMGLKQNLNFRHVSLALYFVTITLPNDGVLFPKVLPLLFPNAGRVAIGFCCYSFYLLSLIGCY